MAPDQENSSEFATSPLPAPSTSTRNNGARTGSLGNTEQSTPMASNQSSKPGYYLRWSRLSKHVTVPTSSSPPSKRRRDGVQDNGNNNINNETSSQHQQRTILQEISGCAAPGQVLAIMGPSGSGKTTLLNTLSGRAVYNSGTLSIDGVRVVTPSRRMKRLMAQVAYVKQKDIFFGHLTVRDQLMYTALLRLPKNHNGTTTTSTSTSTTETGTTISSNNSSSNKAQKTRQVNEMLQLLRLSHVADSPIRLLSGGETKRVNIGTELLTDPRVLLLDEPTSGLDSTNAVALLQLLSNGIAKRCNKTVVTSIHQPSSAVFHRFDRVLLLAAGHVVYFGTPQASLQYLKRQNLPCPDGYNAADHWMDLLVKDANEDVDEDGSNTDEETGALMTSAKERLQQAWDKESVAVEMEQALVMNGNSSNNNVNSAADDEAADETALPSKYKTSWSTQYYYLTHRALKNSRSAIFTPLNLTKSIAIGIVVGLLWFQRDYTEKDVNDIRSYYFFTMTFWVFDSMFQALSAFPTEREVILKERASGSYRLSAYFLAKTTSDAPVRLILPLLYMIISFWMAGFSSDFGVFVGTVGCTLLSVVSGEALGLFIGAAIYDLPMGMTVMTVCTLFLMLLGGFFVENVPSFVAWAKFLSPFKYAFDSSLQLVFAKPMPCDGSGALEELCKSDFLDDDTGNEETTFVSVDDLRAFVGIQGSFALNLGMLILIGFLPRYGAYLALRSKKDGER